MLEGKAYQYQWGSERELKDVIEYMMELHPSLTGKVYGRKHMKGVSWDKSVPKGLWIFEVNERQQE